MRQCVLELVNVETVVLEIGLVEWSDMKVAIVGSPTSAVGEIIPVVKLRVLLPVVHVRVSPSVVCFHLTHV